MRIPFHAKALIRIWEGSEKRMPLLPIIITWEIEGPATRKSTQVSRQRIAYWSPVYQQEATFAYGIRAVAKDCAFSKPIERPGNHPLMVLWHCRRMLECCRLQGSLFNINYAQDRGRKARSLPFAVRLLLKVGTRKLPAKVVPSICRWKVTTPPSTTMTITQSSYDSRSQQERWIISFSAKKVWKTAAPLMLLLSSSSTFSSTSRFMSLMTQPYAVKDTGNTATDLGCPIPSA